MNIVIDENITFATETFSHFGQVSLLHGREITNAALKQADALIVRSITKVNRQLLEGTPVRFVGTATIGTDHIDKNYLRDNAIAFADAKGCNADAVTEYIITAVFRLLDTLQATPEQLRFGIIGCGNIGGRLARVLPELGFTVIKNDPPLERAGHQGFSPLSEILGCDIITCHTPLNNGGLDNTVHLIGEKELSSAKNLKLLLNASRGEVVSGDALKKTIVSNKLLTVLDVWEHEPSIDSGVLLSVNLASPHIAGYTYEGKVNGTVMMYEAFKKFTALSGLPGAREIIAPLIEPARNTTISIDIKQPVSSVLHKICSHIYDIDEDTRMLKSSAAMAPKARGAYFDSLRKDYKLRREFTNYTVHLNAPDTKLQHILRVLRFNVSSQ
ncbi:MAG: 4-phosphoerythronate dehydrogenase [Ignavibacteriales bacterium]|nr:4-phosphoerythronate dehydrogenase [Ignavibacteriales bacterium]